MNNAWINYLKVISLLVMLCWLSLCLLAEPTTMRLTPLLIEFANSVVTQLLVSNIWVMVTDYNNAYFIIAD